MSAWERRADDVADVLLWQALSQSPTLGSSRLVCIDGPAGAGKTTLADALLRAGSELGSVSLVHMDDVYQGWDGLEGALATVEDQVVAPLREGRPGRFQRYDWHAGRLGEWLPVPVCDLLVIEGVGSGAAACADAITTLVWLDAPAALREERALRRDGEALRSRWEAWKSAEAALFARQRTKQRADVHVDGSGEGERAVVFR